MPAFELARVERHCAPRDGSGTLVDIAISARAHLPATTPRTGVREGAWADARQALAVWLVFLLVFALINGTIPFLLGVDLRWWSTSVPKRQLIGTLIYGVLFLVIPVALTVERTRLREPDLWLALALALMALALWPAARVAGVIVLVVIVCLHARYDLRGLGLGSRGWKRDVAAIGVLAALSLLLTAMQNGTDDPSLEVAASAALDRMLFNPASTVENLFYFGFLAERLSRWLGVWVTPLAVGSLYMLHEMTNPEYWYVGLRFELTFVGAVALASLYLLRRNVVAVWLADGACRFASRLF
jgi:hypothetical protein